MPQEIDSANNVRPAKGQVWVSQGKVYVSNAPDATDEAPTITPCADIELYVNGTKVDGKTSVTENDEIKLAAFSRDEPGQYKVKVSPDMLTAILELTTGKITRVSVCDSEPQKDLVLKAEKTVEIACPFNLEQIMQDLNRYGIVHGINNNVILSVLEKPEDGEYIIASGDPPGQTIHGNVELSFLEGQEQKESKSQDKVNFREMNEILSVEAGQLLAVYRPGAQGAPGRTVTGEFLMAPSPAEFDLKGGKGVDMSSDGAKAFAKIGGRPVAKKLGNRYIIDVEPVLHKKGDVDISTGNIRFNGDIVVHGNVQEGMLIQASGKINVKGAVFQARLASQGDIGIAQNITGSSLVAGGNNKIIEDLRKTIPLLHTDLLEIARALPELARHPKFQGVKTGQIVQLLIDKKYTRVPAVVDSLCKMASQSSYILPSNIDVLINSVQENFKGINVLKIDSAVTLHKVISQIEDVLLFIENITSDKAGISFSYAINSNIEASGDVRVVGRGCINTVIRAGGNVSVKGVFRGGEINTRKDVVLNEAGSEMGVKTFIKVAEGRKVLIKKAFAGVVIQIGDRRASIISTQNNLKAELDSTGAIDLGC